VVLGGGAADSGKPVRLDVILEHSAEPVVTTVPGLPVRVELAFPREPLERVFAGKVIAVDPGHGGGDAGIRGPVNLLEKNVALDVALVLQRMLSDCGAAPLMSRDRDCDVDPRGWAVALSVAETALLVEIHASGERDPMDKAYHVYARRGSVESMLAAREIAGALTERMGTPFQGIETMDFAAIPLWPAVRVEPVCLTHFVDEANFRAPLFRKRIAQAIFNGMSRYLSASSPGGITRAG
jgi:N-acetylmuramoyl-L-alanine amidase